MRKIWKMRKIFIPQAAALLLVLTTVVLSPNMGVCSVPAQKTLSNTTAEGAIIITTYETKDDEGKLVVKTTSSVKKKEIVHTRATSGKDINASRSLEGLDVSVVEALRKMDLTPEHIDKWVGSHPNSTLSGLNKMPANKQRKVANIATFIRSINKNISPQIAWREASALVYYSAKYNVPTDLSVGIAKTESLFNPSAMSHKGALGVMQVMWKVHHGMLSAKGIATTKDHMFDPERGVEAGVLLLSRYIGAYGTVQKALNRY
ncbi:MAG: transglycosylase SLT domain-containing protein, partial [Synergistaceae bacterium]|nr:transglycosylase SLT domain-containing protein [Synergistaceae bacterium]